MRNCEALKEKILLYLSGELLGAEALELKQHLASCPDCQKEFSELKKLDQFLKQAGGMGGRGQCPAPEKLVEFLAKETQELKQHLNSCPFCREELSLLKAEAEQNPVPWQVEYQAKKLPGWLSRAIKGEGKEEKPGFVSWGDFLSSFFQKPALSLAGFLLVFLLVILTLRYQVSMPRGGEGEGEGEPALTLTTPQAVGSPEFRAAVSEKKVSGKEELAPAVPNLAVLPKELPAGKPPELPAEVKLLRQKPGAKVKIFSMEKAGEVSAPAKQGVEKDKGELPAGEAKLKSAVYPQAGEKPDSLGQAQVRDQAAAPPAPGAIEESRPEEREKSGVTLNRAAPRSVEAGGAEVLPPVVELEKALRGLLNAGAGELKVKLKDKLYFIQTVKPLATLERLRVLEYLKQHFNLAPQRVKFESL